MNEYLGVLGTRQLCIRIAAVPYEAGLRRVSHARQPDPDGVAAMSERFFSQR